jgi:hypothetical protein
MAVFPSTSSQILYRPADICTPNSAKRILKSKEHRPSSLIRNLLFQLVRQIQVPRTYQNRLFIKNHSNLMFYFESSHLCCCWPMKNGGKPPFPSLTSMPAHLVLERREPRWLDSLMERPNRKAPNAFLSVRLERMNASCRIPTSPRAKRSLTSLHHRDGVSGPLPFPLPT